jgi:hypothetical protein
MSHNNPGILLRSPHSPATSYVLADGDTAEMGSPVNCIPILAQNFAILSTNRKATV